MQFLELTRRLICPGECCLPHCFRRGNTVPQYSDPFDLNLDNVSGFHCPRASGSPRKYKITGHQRDVLTHITDNGTDIEEKIAGTLRLDCFAVQPCFKEQIVVF